MITDIQYFAAHYVQFQENLKIDQKEEIIHWIKESSDDQIKSLLITGEYEFAQEAVDTFDGVFGVLNEANPIPADAVAAKDMGITGVADIFGRKVTGFVDMDKLLSFIKGQQEIARAQGFSAGEVAGQKAGAITGAAGALAATAIAALVITVAYKAYKKYLSKAARACSGQKGVQKTSCMNKYKRDAKKKQISDLKMGIAGCVKTKYPEKCKAKIVKKMQKLQSQLGSL